ncbi:MAG: anthranilate phosphoribosyltransferase [Acidimicrobiales bacterium]|jgi:anthranilate phosphoribosyltransferase|nr:anthranilate phosphoribosyltransferase [Acidimicrobiales bacterium]
MTTLEELGGWRVVLAELTAGHDLTRALAAAALGEILAGRATDSQIGAFIVALRMKGEAVEEVSGMVDAMLEAAAPLELAHLDEVIDIVGTGGAPTRRVHALNVSTMSCFVAAGAGARVCKHGNRKASSTSGSFDLLDALGVAVELDGPAVARCVEGAGLGFCFARAFHPAMRHVGPVRAELGVPTVFNFLGPLSHPARVRRQVIGVSDPRVAPTVVGVLQARGARRAMVVHGHDGMDELTLTGPTDVFELRDGEVHEYQITPTSVGLPVYDAEDLKGGDPAENAVLARRVLGGETGPYRDIVALNAAAGLVVAGKAQDLVHGLELARASIDEGRAAAVLDRLVELAGPGVATA